MSKKVTTNHVAIQCSDRKAASIFFTQVLKIPLLRTFSITDQLSSKIFNINGNVEVDVYDNESSRFEVFIKEKSSPSEYEHVCVEVDDKKEFITNCKKHSLKPFFVKKGEKELLFVRDFSDNLFEIKEK